MQGFSFSLNFREKKCLKPRKLNCPINNEKVEDGIKHAMRCRFANRFQNLSLKVQNWLSAMNYNTYLLYKINADLS